MEFITLLGVLLYAHPCGKIFLRIFQKHLTNSKRWCIIVMSTKVDSEIKKKEVDHVREERNRIRWMLSQNTLTNTWLMKRLEERGVVTEKTELSSVLHGVRKGAKAEAIIKTSLDILSEYEEKMSDPIEKQEV